MDLNAKTRLLQITLQERSKQHLQAIKKYFGSMEEEMKNARSYLILTFLLMRHFTLNTKPDLPYLYDQSV